MQYGTVPVVSSTGGLVDTVKEGTTGFHMGAFDPDKLNSADADAIAATVQRASQVGCRTVCQHGLSAQLFLIRPCFGGGCRSRAAAFLVSRRMKQTQTLSDTSVLPVFAVLHTHALCCLNTFI
jgi:glycogen synthase